MNKWIPISLLIFLGLYLLTTSQAVNFVPDKIQMAETQPVKLSNAGLSTNSHDDRISMQ